MKIAMDRRKWIIASVLCATACFLAFYVWTEKSSASDVIYLADAARRQPLQQTIVATGEVKSAHLVTVGAQVSGQITNIYVRVGQTVSKGELIAEINATKQRNQLETDKAQLRSYQAQLVSKKISQKAADRQYRRTKSLLACDAAAPEDLESAETTAALAKADVAELEAQIRQTELAVNTDTENLGYTRITAPLAGTVVSIPVDEGQTVNATQSTPTIAQIADLGSMELCLDISEGDIPLLQPGMQVSYTILGAPDEARQATLTSIDPGLTTLSDGTYKSSTSSTSSGSTSTSSSSSSSSAVYYYGKALVDNTDGRLRIGMTVQATIVAARKSSALTVPLLAVEHDAKGAFVRVLGQGDTPEIRRVVIGISDKSRMEITSGLREGENVAAGQVTRKELAAQAKQRGPGGPH